MDRAPSAAAIGAGALAGALAAALWWRRNPSPCPYAQRFWVELPHPPSVGRERLAGFLDPRPGQRMLEVGPGTGYYTLTIAERLGDGGRLDILDVQRAMLDHTMGRAHKAGLTNVVATEGDAQRLPYPDGSFDAAYLCTTLGEVPDQGAALRELRRVVRPGGPVVVGEVRLDPHVVRIGDLRARAEAAGLRFERREGGIAGYLARFSV